MSSSSALMAATPEYYEALYAMYRRDPGGVDASWRIVFSLVDDLTGGGDRSGKLQEGDVCGELAGLLRSRGHMLASLNPLITRTSPNMADFCASQACASYADVRQSDPLIGRLLSLFCETLAVETSHIDSGLLRQQILDSFERRSLPDTVARRRALDLLIRAETFEQMLGVRYPTKKRFGAEGAEAILVLLDRVLCSAAAAGVREVIIGSMHRGRLNILANVLNKPLQQLFADIIGAHPLTDGALPADVPYHLGHRARVDFGSAVISVSLTPNPSHLEAVNAVAIGRTRGRQDQAERGHEVMCIVLHTDASVIGQGVVAETVQMSALAGYQVAGTVHLIINNQIGFTTNPYEARTSRYCTGAWKAVDCPILHVNGDAVDDVLAAADLAVSFRMTHRQDAVVDFVCYRRNGHNEVDEPRFTQPLEYSVIDQHPSVLDLYAAQLRAEGLVEEGYVERVGEQSRGEYENALKSAQESQTASGRSARVAAGSDPIASNPETGVAVEQLEQLATVLSNLPDGMTVGKKVAKLVVQRRASVTSGIPWALAEALAFASLLVEGHPVRLSGQDVGRGAFSHRHFILTDTANGSWHVSLNHLSAKQSRFDIVNSLLSEYAVLGFEYGYSLERPDTLTVWEAQFGDFANGAQIIFDQFVASGEAKWGQRSGLVMLLPHGLEGQGPEHSSARPERYLQLAAGNNFELVHPTTPANYFHLLRRQLLRSDRVPLVVMSPKTLLRLPAAVSPLAAFDRQERFQPLIASVPRTPSRVLICSGKIAYLLEEERQRRNASDVAIVRLEILYPLPEEEMIALFRQWRDATFTWVQEEPKNYGAWNYLDRRLESILQRSAVNANVTCVSRPEQSSPAGSFHGIHEQDQRELIARAFAPAENLNAVFLRARRMSTDV